MAEIHDKLVSGVALAGLIRAIICIIVGAIVIADMARFSLMSDSRLGYWGAFSVGCATLCDGILSGIASALLIHGLR